MAKPIINPVKTTANTDINDTIMARGLRKAGGSYGGIRAGFLLLVIAQISWSTSRSVKKSVSKSYGVKHLFKKEQKIQNNVNQVSK